MRAIRKIEQQSAIESFIEGNKADKIERLRQELLRIKRLIFAIDSGIERMTPNQLKAVQTTIGTHRVINSEEILFRTIFGVEDNGKSGYNGIISSQPHPNVNSVESINEDTVKRCLFVKIDAAKTFVKSSATKKQRFTNYAEESGLQVMLSNENLSLGTAYKYARDAEKHLFVAPRLFNDIYAKPVDIETFMNVGCNVPEIAFLSGTTNEQARKSRLFHYRSIDAMEISDEKHDKLTKTIKRLAGKLDDERIKTLSAKDKMFLSDLDNRGVKEARDTLLRLYKINYLRALRYYKAEHPEWFDNWLVQEAVDFHLEDVFVTAMDYNNNHFYSGLPLGYRAVERETKKLIKESEKM